jgi:hypothetical protein
MHFIWNRQVYFEETMLKAINPIILSPYALKNLYREAYSRDKGLCRLCNLPVRPRPDYHHIIPRGRVRLDVLENLATFHRGCHADLHRGIGGITIDDFIEMNKEQLGEYYDYNRTK